MDPVRAEDLPPKVREAFDRIMTQLRSETMPVIVCPQCGGDCVPDVRGMRQGWTCGGCGLRLETREMKVKI